MDAVDGRSDCTSGVLGNDSVSGVSGDMKAATVASECNEEDEVDFSSISGGGSIPPAH